MNKAFLLLNKRIKNKAFQASVEQQEKKYFFVVTGVKYVDLINFTLNFIDLAKSIELTYLLHLEG